MRRLFGSSLKTAGASTGADTLAVSRFTTPQATSRDRHEAWVSQGWPSVTQLCDFLPDGEFSASSKTVSLGSFGVTVGGYGAQDVHRSPDLLRTAPADHLIATIPLDVAINTQSGVVSPGSISVTDLTQEWRHHAPQGAMIVIPVPRSMALEQRINPRDVHGVTINPDDASLVRGKTLSIVQHAVTTPRASASALADTIIKLLAVELARMSGAGRPTAAAKNMAIRCRAENLVLSSLRDEDLSVRLLADSLGVSRSHLYRIFSDGDGIDRAILRERLHAAARDIADTDGSIANIAERYNFKEYSHFSRAFLAEMDMRPTEWRMRVHDERLRHAAGSRGDARSAI